MSRPSSVFLEVDDFERQPGVYRSRSNGYLDDFIRDQPAWERRGREQQVTHYRDGQSTTIQNQRRSSDRLCVPVYEVSPRRPRAGSDSRVGYRSDDNPRSLQTHGVRPASGVVTDRAVSTESVPDNQAKLRGSTQSRSPRYEKPKIKVQIVQDDPPTSTTT
jgi:hypothetical protein